MKSVAASIAISLLFSIMLTFLIANSVWAVKGWDSEVQNNVLLYTPQKLKANKSFQVSMLPVVSMQGR